MKRQGLFELDFSNGFYDDASQGFSNSIFKWLFKVKRHGFFKLDFSNGFLR